MKARGKRNECIVRQVDDSHGRIINCDDTVLIVQLYTNSARCFYAYRSYKLIIKREIIILSLSKSDEDRRCSRNNETLSELHCSYIMKKKKEEVSVWFSRPLDSVSISVFFRVSLQSWYFLCCKGQCGPMRRRHVLWCWRRDDKGLLFCSVFDGSRVI